LTRASRSARAPTSKTRRNGIFSFPRLRRLIRPILHPLSVLPRGVGSTFTILFVIAAIAYGTMRGDHIPLVLDQLKDARDGLANAVGFRIEQAGVAGRHQLSHDEVLALAGVTKNTSLLFLDVEAARGRLKASPWIAEASVRKLYPGRLIVDIEERVPYALWQKDGKLSVIAADGTVLGPLDDKRFATLPLVVGPGAEKKAKEFFEVLAHYPALRDSVRASILVAERRWNLKLANGIDIRLPETKLETALDTLVALDRDKKLLTRDITAVDLRLPDRVNVRLSDTAAQARDDAMKIKKPKAKGGNA
jgi:cell division protein FtsQ